MKIAVAGTAVLLVFAFLLAFAWIFVPRAEKLSQHVMALEPGKATFNEAQALRERYRSYIHDEGACEPDSCSFWLAVPNIAYRAWLDWEWLRAIGFRPARATALIMVKDGKVSRVSFRISYRTAEGHWLDADSKAVSSFTHEEQCLNSSAKRHPNYELGSGQITTEGGGRFLRAAYASGASALERKHAQTISLRCMVKFETALLPSSCR